MAATSRSRSSDLSSTLVEMSRDVDTVSSAPSCTFLSFNRPLHYGSTLLSQARSSYWADATDSDQCTQSMSVMSPEGSRTSRNVSVVISSRHSLPNADLISSPEPVSRADVASRIRAHDKSSFDEHLKVPNQGNTWTKEENDILETLILEGKKVREMQPLLPNRAPVDIWCRKQYLLNEKTSSPSTLIRKGGSIWLADEDRALVQSCHERKEWKSIMKIFPNRSPRAVYSRSLLLVNEGVLDKETGLRKPRPNKPQDSDTDSQAIADQDVSSNNILSTVNPCTAAGERNLEATIRRDLEWNGIEALLDRPKLKTKRTRRHKSVMYKEVPNYTVTPWFRKENSQTHRKKWTADEDQTLLQLVREGYSLESTSKYLKGRSESACSRRHRRLTNKNSTSTKPEPSPGSSRTFVPSSSNTDSQHTPKRRLPSMRNCLHSSRPEYVELSSTEENDSTDSGEESLIRLPKSPRMLQSPSCASWEPFHSNSPHLLPFCQSSSENSITPPFTPRSFSVVPRFPTSPPTQSDSVSCRLTEERRALFTQENVFKELASTSKQSETNCFAQKRQTRVSQIEKLKKDLKAVRQRELMILGAMAATIQVETLEAEKRLAYL